MVRRAPTAEPTETDRIAGFAHPRETHSLIGQDAALAQAAQAIRGGRPPSAWLLCGPPGIGKATLAYRIARYLLAYGARATGAADLDVPANDPATIQVAAGSHPGLLVLKRGLNPNTGKLMSVVSVAEIRRLAGFFGMTSGAGGWRIAIIDTADDMNDNAANALLKLLEEPPARALLLLLSNTPGRVLPPLRSRCRRRELRPLDSALIEDELARLLPASDAKDRAALARLSGGSIGGALQLAGGEGMALAAEADRLIDAARNPDTAALLALGERIARITDGLDMFGDFLGQALAARIRARAMQGGAHLDRWASVLTRLNSLFARSTGLHLEPRQTILSAARQMAMQAQRMGPL
jgi:DNA polymerase-3 subunit delta'